MPCECIDADHRFTLFRRRAHWPGERFIVSHVLALFDESGHSAHTAEELTGVVASIVGPLGIAETKYENSLNFGTVKLDGDGWVEIGDVIPRRLLNRNDFRPLNGPERLPAGEVGRPREPLDDMFQEGAYLHLKCAFTRFNGGCLSGWP